MMKLAERLPPIPFEGTWRWRVVPYTSTHMRIKLQQKIGLFWYTHVKDVVDPFVTTRGYTIEDRTGVLLRKAERQLINETGLSVTYKNGTQDAR